MDYQLSKEELRETKLNKDEFLKVKQELKSMDRYILS